MLVLEAAKSSQGFNFFPERNFFTDRPPFRSWDALQCKAIVGDDLVYVRLTLLTCGDGQQFLTDLKTPSKP